MRRMALLPPATIACRKAWAASGNKAQLDAASAKTHRKNFTTYSPVVRHLSRHLRSSHLEPYESKRRADFQ
jgi:hypothetical protein